MGAGALPRPAQEAALALHLLGHQAREDPHELRGPLRERGIWRVAQDAERAVEGAVGEPDGRAHVGADARPAGDLQDPHPPVGLGVGDHVREASLQESPTEGVVQRHALALFPAEGSGLAHQLAEDHPPVGELRDEGHVHAELLPGRLQHLLHGLGGTLRGAL